MHELKRVFTYPLGLLRTTSRTAAMKILKRRGENTHPCRRSVSLLWSDFFLSRQIIVIRRWTSQRMVGTWLSPIFNNFAGDRSIPLF